tara:strand:- start:595 stop:1131 length:537 start_codon:yes stop_codon:yes gene_type:complete
MLKNFTGVIVIIAASFLLEGCGIMKNKKPYPCPQVLLLNDAKKLVKFNTLRGNDITDILFESEFQHFVGKCQYFQKNGNWNIDVGLKVQIIVERGAANKEGNINFTYFAAIPAFQPSPAGKKLFQVKGKFIDSKVRLLYQDDLSMRIPVESPNLGSKFEIILGFQLSPEELNFNRTQR